LPPSAFCPDAPEAGPVAEAAGVAGAGAVTSFVAVWVDICAEGCAPVCGASAGLKGSGAVDEAFGTDMAPFKMAVGVNAGAESVVVAVADPATAADPVNEAGVGA